MWPVLAELSLFGRPLTLTGYGIFAILGAVAGTYLCVRTARRLSFPVFDAFAAATLALAFGLVGAKLLYLAVSLPRLREQGLLALLQHGGLVWYGGVVGGGVAALAYLRAYRLDPWTFADAAAPGVALGHAFGRLGCLMAGCCHGRPTSLPWGVRFPESPYFGGPAGVPLHPVQLYEAGAELVLAFVTWRLAGRVGRGVAFGAWLVGYAAVRLAMELAFRGDDRGLGALGLPPSAAASLAALVLGAGLLLRAGGLTRQSKLS